MDSCFDVNTDPLRLTHSDPAIEAFKDFAAEIRSQGNPRNFSSILSSEVPRPTDSVL